MPAAAALCSSECLALQLVGLIDMQSIRDCLATNVCSAGDAHVTIAVIVVLRACFKDRKQGESAPHSPFTACIINTSVSIGIESVQCHIHQYQVTHSYVLRLPPTLPSPTAGMPTSPAEKRSRARASVLLPPLSPLLHVTFTRHSQHCSFGLLHYCL